MTPFYSHFQTLFKSINLSNEPICDEESFSAIQSTLECEDCLDNGCMTITTVLPLPGGGFRICATSSTGPQNWTMYVDAVAVGTASATESPCFTVSSGTTFQLVYIEDSTSCSKSISMPANFECPSELVTFDFVPGCGPLDVSINIDVEELYCTPFVITFGESGYEPILTSDPQIVKSFPVGTYDICITMCVEGGAGPPQIITCCYELESYIVCCDTADFTFYQNELSPSCINPEFPLISDCVDSIYNEHIWIFSDGKTFYGPYPPNPYHFTDFVNTSGEVCVTHIIICCGDTLTPVTKCLPHFEGAYIGWPGEDRRLSDPIEPWATNIAEFIHLYADDLDVPLLIDGKLILDLDDIFINGWWHMGESALIHNETRLFGLSGTTIQSAGRHYRGYGCCRWKGVDNEENTRTWWNNAVVSDAWRMLHYPSDLGGSIPPVIWSQGGLYHTNLFGIRSDVPVTFRSFSGNQLIGHNEEHMLSEGCDCTAINAIDFRSGSIQPIISIGNGQFNNISFYEQGFHFENFGLKAKRFNVFDLEDYPDSGILTAWNNPDDVAATGIDFLWGVNGTTTLEIDTIHFYDLYPQAAASIAVNADITRGRLILTAMAADPLSSITIDNVRTGYDIDIARNARIHGNVRNNLIQTGVGGINLVTRNSSSNNFMAIDANQIETNAQNQDNFGIQLGGIFQPLVQQYFIRQNEITNSSQYNGNAVSVTNAINTLIAHNIIEEGNNNNVQGIRLTTSHNSEVRCNFVENYMNGVLAMGNTDAQYSGNVLQSSDWNFHLGGMSANALGTTVRWNQFLEQHTGTPHVLYDDDAMTWNQNHNMYNTWDWNSLNTSEVELQHLDPSLLGLSLFSQYRYPSGASSPSAHRPVFTPTSFMKAAGNSNITTIGSFCALTAPPNDPNDQQLSGPLGAAMNAFAFYENLLLTDTLWALYTSAQGSALKQHIYALLQDSTSWGTNTTFADFISEHDTGFIGQSVALQLDFYNYSPTVSDQQGDLLPWNDALDSLQQLMMGYFEVAADTANTALQDSLNLLGTDLLPQIAVIEDTLLSLQSLFDSLNAITLSDLNTDNTALNTSLIHEDYEQIINALIIKQLQGTTWDSTDLANLHDIAGSCYPDGGRAVWQARAICRYQYFIWYEVVDCVTPERSISALSSELEQPSFIMLQPNPTGDVTCLYLQESWPIEATDITVANQMGQEVWRHRVQPVAGECILVPSKNWAPGTYYLRVQGGNQVETKKLIINR